MQLMRLPVGQRPRAVRTGRARAHVGTGQRDQTVAIERQRCALQGHFQRGCGAFIAEQMIGKPVRIRIHRSRRRNADGP